MRIRTGFVSNSSSASFMVINKTDKPLTIADFVTDNPQLIEKYIKEYGYKGCNMDGYTQGNLLVSAEEEDETLYPGENYTTFGDEDGTLIGRVFDYILRDGGTSDRFSWRFVEYHR